MKYLCNHLILCSFGLCLLYTAQVSAVEGDSLSSGGMVSGSLGAPGYLASYAFDASSGDTIHLSAGSTKQTSLSVYNPDGSLLGNAHNGYKEVAPSSGTYRIDIVPRYAYQSGNFVLHYINSSNADEHGSLLSGSMAQGSFTANDLDSYSFVASAGDTIHLSAGSKIQTYLSVYKPDGSLLGNAYNGYKKVAPISGVYRAVIQSRYGFQTGTYELHYINGSTTKEHGYLSSGSMAPGSFTANDLDSYSFVASAGDTIHLSAGSKIQTYLSVYKPDGSLLGNAYNGYKKVAPISGVYRAVIQSRYGFQTGTYELHYVNGSTTKEHGFLINGVSSTGTITTNDLDSYELIAESGDTITLSTTGSSIFTYLSVYKPDGSLLGVGKNYYSKSNVAESGIYRVVAQSFYGFQTGDYYLSLVSSGNTLVPIPSVCSGVPESIVPNDGSFTLFDTPKEAVIDAISGAWSEYDDWYNHEYGGEIYEVCVGENSNESKYTYTRRRGGTTSMNGQMDMNKPGAIAGWHTHPLCPYTMAPGLFSSGDAEEVARTQKSLYLGNPEKGTILELPPIGQILTTARIPIPAPPEEYYGILEDLICPYIAFN